MPRKKACKKASSFCENKSRLDFMATGLIPASTQEIQLQTYPIFQSASSQNTSKPLIHLQLKLLFEPLI